MANDVQEIPLEFVISDIKKSVAQYVSGLCQQYQIPAAIAIQILQEIVYENRMSAYSSYIDTIRIKSMPQYEMDLTPPEVEEKLGNVNTQSEDKLNNK